ncbi:MAG: hypothetical protein WBE13_12590 [Candidatus Acidiferrum sp.]
MLRYARCAGTRLYAVEVSGWNCTQNFFVERCDLVWNEDSGKQVVLKQSLRESAILFVRLLQPGESDRSYPVAYEAEFVGKTQNGLRQFRLNAVVPRLREEGVAMAQASLQK